MDLKTTYLRDFLIFGTQAFDDKFGQELDVKLGESLLCRLVFGHNWELFSTFPLIFEEVIQLLDEAYEMVADFTNILTWRQNLKYFSHI